MLISKIAGTTTSLQRFLPKKNVYTYVFNVKESNKTHLKTHNIHVHGENLKNAHNINLFATAYVSTDYHLSTNVMDSDCVSYILIKGQM